MSTTLSTPSVNDTASFVFLCFSLGSRVYTARRSQLLSVAASNAAAASTGLVGADGGAAAAAAELGAALGAVGAGAAEASPVVLVVAMAAVGEGHKRRCSHAQQQQSYQ